MISSLAWGVGGSFWHSVGMQSLTNALPVLLKGAWVTVEITILAVAFGTLIGLFFGIMRLSKNKLIFAISAIYVDFIRGTPLLVQVFLVYFGVMPLIMQGASPFLSAVVACSINSGAYVAEIVRAGIQSVDRGQTEAAHSLGMNGIQTMWYIILPQAFKMMIPPLINEFIAMMKDTSLVSVIAVEELTRKGQLQVAVTYQPLYLWTGVALFYLVLTIIISQLGRMAERRLATE